MSELRATFPMNGAAYRQVLDLGLTEEQADRWAVRLGLEPWLVWEEWEDAKARRRRKQAEWARAKYQRDPEHRARKRAANTGYNAAARRAVRLSQRRYRIVNAEQVRAAKRAWHAANRDEVNARRRERYRAQRQRDAQTAGATVQAMTDEEAAA